MAWAQIAPKEDENKALQKYDGPMEELSLPEQFLLVMSTVPRLNEKIHLLILVHQFEVYSPVSDQNICAVIKHALHLHKIKLQWPLVLCM